MATTFIGSACTSRIAGTGDNVNAYVFAIENGKNSSVDVRPLRGVFQLDPSVTTALTAVMPTISGYRASVISQPLGAMLIPKAGFKTSYTSDSEVKIWSAYSADGNDMNPLSATESGGKGYRSFAPRLHDLTGQVLSDDGEIMPETLDTSALVLRPGESLVWEIYVASAFTNPLNNEWFFNVVWQEDTTATFTISGVVTLSAVGVVGAKVTVLIADDTSLTNAVLHEVVTTTAGGAWTSNIPTGKVAYAYGQNYTGGTYYTSPGAPYIT